MFVGSQSATNAYLVDMSVFQNGADTMAIFVGACLNALLDFRPGLTLSALILCGAISILPLSSIVIWNSA
jgi:hypothetical protein